MIAQTIRRARRAVQLGPRETVRIIDQRVRTRIFEWSWRRKALAKKAGHAWADIDVKPFDKNLCSFPLPDIYKHAVDDQTVIADAQAAVLGVFDLLGSGQTTFSAIHWHVDFRLRNQDSTADCQFDPTIFYKDYCFRVGHGHQMVKDIKVPWELSRCYHLYLLGRAYAATQQSVYVYTFVEHITSWMHDNPFMLGVNWVCPMEVGLRAINWITAASFFSTAPNIPDSFWQSFATTLYDHFFYLEHNWEIYDGRTSNHYLSDLIGYWYLCHFFSFLPDIDAKKKWCYQEIIREFDKQVFAEGTNYEGSTAYHRLVTELFYHFYVLCQHNGIVVGTAFEDKLSKMAQFLHVSMINERDMVVIGDKDSGRVLWYGLPNKLVNVMTKKQSCALSSVDHYAHFGITMVRKNNVHLSVRHHAYSCRQPSGHFHNDPGSITLAVAGIPVIVDPGSYVYTPSAVWRNHFRSVAAHSTFGVDGVEPVIFDDRLFALNIPEHSEHPAVVSADDGSVVIATEHALYARYGLRAQRIVSVDVDARSLRLFDRWQSVAKEYGYSVATSWNFTLAPGIVAQQQPDGRWVCFYNQRPLISIASTMLHFSINDQWVSSGYGSKQESKALRATKQIAIDQQVVIEIQKLG